MADVVVGLERWWWRSIRLRERAYFGLGGVAEEGSATLGACQGRISPRFGWREGVHDDVFDPIGVVTGTAAILAPFAGLVRAFQRHGDLPRETMTADNGKEFAAFGVLERKLGLDVYFARAYHAWERGLNEQTNGLLRQFFPKGLDLRLATWPYVKYVEALVNHRPRKSLNYRTPHEVLRR